MNAKPHLKKFYLQKISYPPPIPLLSTCAPIPRKPALHDSAAHVNPFTETAVDSQYSVIRASEGSPAYTL